MKKAFIRRKSFLSRLPKASCWLLILYCLFFMWYVIAEQPVWATEFVGGTEFQINTYTLYNQDEPSVAVADSGFVVVWHSCGQDGSYYGVYGRMFDNSGNELGGEFQVNSTIDECQMFPSVASLTDGGFVVVWNSLADVNEHYVNGQRFDSSGNKVGNEFQVSTHTIGFEQHPKVAGLADGGFVVAWESDGQGGSGSDIYGQRFDSSGNKVGNEFQVNTYTFENQYNPSVAALADGGFVVIWDSGEYDGYSAGVYGQRFDTTGNKEGSEFHVNTYTPGNQWMNVVTGLVDGGFVVVWQSWGQDGLSYDDVFGQRFDSTGNKTGTEFLVNSYTSLTQMNPGIAALANGGFLVVWQSWEQDGLSMYDVFGQRFDSTGNKEGSEFQINTYTLYGQDEPSVAALAEGFVVVWESYVQDGSYYGVYGRSFEPENQSPIIDSFTADPTSGVAPLDVTFTCTAHDDDGWIESYTIDYGDSSEAETNSTGIFYHTYDAAGSWEAFCTVTDDEGGTATSDPLIIEVTSGPPMPVKIEDVPNYDTADFAFVNDCGPVALTNVLAYWDDHPSGNPYDRLVDDGSGTDKEKVLWLYEQLIIATSFDENFVRIEWSDEENVAIDIPRASNLVDFVCNESFFGNKYDFQSQIYTEDGDNYPQFTWDICKQEIDADPGRPFLIAIQVDDGYEAPNPDYTDHMVVCVGYRIVGSSRDLIIHDGYGVEAEIDFDQYKDAPGVTLNALAILPDGYTNDVPPEPPAQCSYKRTESSIEITWEPSPSSNVTNYRIYRREGFWEPYERVETITGTFFTDSDVEQDKDYEYVVTAVNIWNYESGPVYAFEDSDGDGLPDSIENGWCTSATDADTDDDGIPDGVEDANRSGEVDPAETDPCSIDTDGDGIQDGTEMGYTMGDIGPDTDTNVFQPDLDPTTTTDPLNPDTDGDGLLDGEEDTNHNGRVDEGETDPLFTIYIDPCNGNTPCYSSIQNAIDAAGPVSTIKVVQGFYDEDVTLNTSKTIALQGGWDSTFTTQSSNTTINSLTISSGTIVPSNIILGSVK